MKIVEIKGGPTNCRACGRRCSSIVKNKHVRLFRIILREGREGTHDSIKGHYIFNLCEAHLLELGSLINKQDEIK